MSKKRSIIFLFLINWTLAITIQLFFGIFGTVFAANFSDVPYSHPYSSSIYLLRSEGVIEGYEDGTYRPESLINRAEFLKIALEATRVDLDISTPTGFSDTDNSAWYAPYLRKAKAEGWIQGYPDGTFRPEQNINKVEALKMLGEIQEWDRLALPEVPEASFKDTYRFIWYSPYVYFAKEKGLLFEEKEYLYPAQEINRGYMAELVYRTMTKDVIKYEPGKTVDEKILATQEVETPSTFKFIGKNFFDKVTLKEEIPSVMYKNEIYVIKGVLDKNILEDDIFAFLSNTDPNDKKYSNFFGDTNNGEFSIPIVFREAGIFNLGIVPGLAGESKIAEITVVDGIPKSGTNINEDMPKSAKLSFKDDTTTLSWEGAQNNIFRIYFMQDKVVQNYIIRGKNNLDVFYQDFKFFNEGEIKVRIYGAKTSSLYPATLESKWAASLDKTFGVVRHHFRLSYDESIVYSNIPETLPTVQEIYVSGTVNEPIFAKGAVINPAGKIDFFEIKSNSGIKKYYGNDFIEEGSTFSFVYKPSQIGTYILEINDTGGSAVVNIPIYIGHYIPLIPDFFDLQDPLEKTTTLNLDESRKELLDYINIERQKHGLSQIRTTQQLNTLAQNHTNDMVEKNFFSHVNLEGKTPNDRRMDLFVYTDVGENLAIGPTVYFAHEALMRSAIHRENILTSYWDTVGIGITKDNYGSLVIAEEFSHDPWTAQDLQNFEYEILDGLNSNRDVTLKLEDELQEIARYWSNQMVEKDYFSFVSPTGENIIDMVKDSGINNEGRAYILKEGSADSLLNKLIEESDITQEDWSKGGLGLAQNIWSTLYLTVIFTQ